MENYTDIIVLTSVVVVLFIVFIIASIREFNFMNTTTFVEKEETGPRAEMIKLIGKIFTDDRIESGKKATFLNAVKTVIEELKPAEELNKEVKK